MSTSADRQKTAFEKEMAEQMRQTRRWRRWVREQVVEHLAKPYPQEFSALRRFLRVMTLADGPRLVEHVVTSPLLNAPLETRVVVLRVVALRIMKLRIQNGFDPISDSLPAFGGPEPPQTVYEVLRDRLRVFGVPREG